VTVRFSHRLLAEDWKQDKFVIRSESGKTVAIQSVKPVNPQKGHAAAYVIETAKPIDFARETYRVEAEGFPSVEIQAWKIVHDGKVYGDASAELGAIYDSRRTTFRVFAPTAQRVDLVIADEVEGEQGRDERSMTRRQNGIHEIEVDGDLAGKYYSYKLHGPGHNSLQEVADIYARCTQNLKPRSIIVDLKQTDPPGFREATFTGPPSPVDAVIYEMSVRDFTIAANSGVDQKGKYLGLAETGTHLADDTGVKTGLDHLVELGITHVQLLPIQDFFNDEETSEYDWGYMPVQFNSPDGWFATEVYSSARITEFKRAVQAFHERGIGVIMDVVYNHTAGEAPFEQLVPGYYFRMTAARNFYNGSGCGNEFNSEILMGRKFILDSIRYWIEEYMIDGFRFDLMGLIDIQTMKEIRKLADSIRPGILLHGEPWVAQGTPLKPITDQGQVRGTGIGAFSDKFRDAIKGPGDGEWQGFIQVGAGRDDIIHGMQGSIHQWTINPSDSLNYFACHDNLTAWDKLLRTTPDVPNEIRRRMMRFGFLIILASQGVPFIHSGQEFCRRKKGYNNSYNLPDDINQINWALKRSEIEVTTYVRNLIALRKQTPAFRLRDRAEVEKRVSFFDAPNDQCVCCHLDGQGLAGQKRDEVIVLLNGDHFDQTFALPSGQWAVFVDEDRAETKSTRVCEGELEIKAHGGYVLMR
jgi:pullulanase